MDFSTSNGAEIVREYWERLGQSKVRKSQWFRLELLPDEDNTAEYGVDVAAGGVVVACVRPIPAKVGLARRRRLAVI